MTDTNETSDSHRDTSDPSDPQGTTIPSSAGDKPSQLDALLTSIRVAVTPDASPDARATGAAACRSLLAALEARPGQPMSAPPPAATATSSPMAAMLKQLASMPREQLIEFLMNRLRSALPPGTSTTPPNGAPRFHLIQIPEPRRP